MDQETPGATTAAPKANPPAKLAETSRSDAPEQQTKPPMPVGKASEWKSKNRPRTDIGTFILAGAKEFADREAAAAAAGRSAPDALAMMPIIPAAPEAADLAHDSPSGSKHEEQKKADEAVPQAAAPMAAKAAAVPEDKAAQPTQHVPKAAGTAHLTTYVALLQFVSVIPGMLSTSVCETKLATYT